MPVAGVTVSEGPNDAAERNALVYMRVMDDVRIIIIVVKRAFWDLPVSGNRYGYQQQNDAEIELVW